MEESVHEADDYKKCPGPPRNRRRRGYGVKRAGSTMGTQQPCERQAPRHDVAKQTNHPPMITTERRSVYAQCVSMPEGYVQWRRKHGGACPACLLPAFIHTALAYSNMYAHRSAHGEMRQVGPSRETLATENVDTHQSALPSNTNCIL